MLDVLDIHKSYDGIPLLKGITFSVGPGETVCLLGPSGSGKSTLLRIIAGLEEAGAGDVRWNGKSLVHVPTHQREFGLMFQDYALFPHRSVAENVAFGLEMQPLSREQVSERVDEALGLVDMREFAGRRVTDLSGGEQQRVALARTLAPRPRLLMLDEPLGALDRTLRESLLLELRTILRRTAELPALYVTHDQEEAFTLADRVILIHDGQIAQAGTPSGVYAEPASAWVVGFLGLGSLIEGRIARQPGFAETHWGLLQPMCVHQHSAGERVSLLLRPNATLMGVAHAENSLSGAVSDVVFQRDAFRVTLAGGIYFYLSFAPAIGETIRISLPANGVQCLGENFDKG